MVLRILFAYLTFVAGENTQNCGQRQVREQWRSLPGISPLPAERDQFLSRIYRQYKGDSATAETLIKQASKSDTRIAEYVNIFQLMKEHDGFYTAAGASLDYKITQLRRDNNNDADLKEMNDYFRTLWHAPYPFDRKITIENKGTHKLLCLPYYNFMVHARMLLKNDTCFWILQMDHSGDFFRMKHIPRDGYMVVEHRIYYDWKKRRVMISAKNLFNQDRWQLIPRSTGDLDVQFKSLYWNEVLYTNQRTRPHTMLASECRDMGCEWTIRMAE